jgi:uncharacterized membrane protein YqjE
MANRDDDDGRGLKDLARSILDHGADYAEARVELAKLETDEAAAHVRGLSVRLGIGAFAATSGYTITVFAGIGMLARHQFSGRWEIPALIAGAVHLLIGGLFLLGARRQARLTSNLFSSTRREFTKDQQWLKQKSPPAE